MLEEEVGEHKVSKPCHLDVINSADAIPSLLVVKNGSWFPVGYSTKKDGSFGSLLNEAFLDEMAKYFAENSLSEKLMLVQRVSKENDVVFIEYNNGETRTSELAPMKSPPKVLMSNLVPTAYNFSRGKNGICEVYCEVRCVVTFDPVRTHLPSELAPMKSPPKVLMSNLVPTAYNFSRGKNGICEVYCEVRCVVTFDPVRTHLVAHIEF